MPARIVDACSFDDRRNEGDLSRKLASTKGVGPDDGRLTELDLAEIALIQFRPHAQRGHVADDQQRLRVAGEFPRLAIDLQHRPGDGRADRQSFDCRRRGRRFSACNVDLALGKGRQGRARIGFDAAQLGFLLLLALARPCQHRARRLDRRVRCCA